MDSTRQRPHVQFTIRRLLWTTFCIAVCVAFGRLGLLSDDALFAHLGLVVLIVGPCIAVGVLLGRPKTGLSVGVLLTLVTYETIVVLMYNTIHS